MEPFMFAVTLLSFGAGVFGYGRAEALGQGYVPVWAPLGLVVFFVSLFYWGLVT